MNAAQFQGICNGTAINGGVNFAAMVTITYTLHFAVFFIYTTGYTGGNVDPCSDHFHVQVQSTPTTVWCGKRTMMDVFRNLVKSFVFFLFRFGFIQGVLKPWRGAKL